VEDLARLGVARADAQHRAAGEAALRRLARGGADVHFVARGAHLRAMRGDGLRIEGPEPMHVPRMNATDDPAGIVVVDLVPLCVKLWDTDDAVVALGRETGVPAPLNRAIADILELHADGRASS
jgi:2-dehydropantoate 2-reductase